MHLTNITYWHYSRWIVLLAGLFFSGQAIYFLDAVPALLGIFLLYQAITGNGCLVYGSCINTIKREKIENEDGSNLKNIEYTTIEEN